MQVLVIDDQFKRRAAEIREFASKPENVYRPGPDAVAPGDNPNFALESGNCRIVFSLTYDAGQDMIFRHFSMSASRRTVLPNPIVVAEVLPYFGFVGGLDMCQIHVDQEENVVVIAQFVNFKQPLEDLQ
jgi:hypothetical protein